METWLVEIFDPIDKIWKKEIRYYYSPKENTDFDLHDIKDKRKNAIKIMN